MAVKSRCDCILTQGERLTGAETERMDPQPSHQTRKPRNFLSAVTESTQIFQISSGTLLWAREADAPSPRTRALTTPLPGLSSEDRPSIRISPCLHHIWLLWAWTGPRGSPSQGRTRTRWGLGEHLLDESMSKHTDDKQHKTVARPRAGERACKLGRVNYELGRDPAGKHCS